MGFVLFLGGEGALSFGSGFEGEHFGELVELVLEVLSVSLEGDLLFETFGIFGVAFCFESLGRVLHRIVTNLITYIHYHTQQQSHP